MTEPKPSPEAVAELHEMLSHDRRDGETEATYQARLDWLVALTALNFAEGSMEDAYMAGKDEARRQSATDWFGICTASRSRAWQRYERTLAPSFEAILHDPTSQMDTHGEVAQSILRHDDDPFTMERRLCDDDGMVSKQPCTDENLFAPDLTYLGQINNLRGHGGHPPVTEPFACTGSAHLAGEHIRCTSPAHARAASQTFVNFDAVPNASLLATDAQQRTGTDRVTTDLAASAPDRAADVVGTTPPTRSDGEA